MKCVQGKTKNYECQRESLGNSGKKAGTLDINRFPLNGLCQGIYSPLT